MRGSLPRIAYFESLRAAEAKNAVTINQLKYLSRSCFMEDLALGAWSRAIFPVMHSHGTLTSIYFYEVECVHKLYIYCVISLSY